MPLKLLVSGGIQISRKVQFIERDIKKVHYVNDRVS